MELEFDDDHESLLIWLYLEIADLVRQLVFDLYPLRLSNNKVPLATDAELFTCCIFAELMGYRVITISNGTFITGFHYYPVMKCTAEN